MHSHDIASAILNAETAVGGVWAWKQVTFHLKLKIDVDEHGAREEEVDSVKELQFLKVRNFRDILRYLENFWRYLESFWRYLEFFSRISRKIFRPSLGVFVSEPAPLPKG